MCNTLMLIATADWAGQSANKAVCRPPMSLRSRNKIDGGTGERCREDLKCLTKRHNRRHNRREQHRRPHVHGVQKSQPARLLVNMFCLHKINKWQKAAAHWMWQGWTLNPETDGDSVESGWLKASSLATGSTHNKTVFKNANDTTLGGGGGGGSIVNHSA